MTPNGRSNFSNANSNGNANGNGNGNGSSPKPEASNKDAETLLAIMLNSEYVMYKLYSAHPIDMNPALSHWVGDCKEFDRYEREYRDSNREWGIRERVLKIRQAFVKGILLGEGKAFSKMTPQDVAILGKEYKVDLRTFYDALCRQGNYLSPPSSRSPSPSPPSFSPSSATTPQNTDPNDIIPKLLLSHQSALHEVHSGHITVRLFTQPHLTSTIPLSFVSPDSLTGMLHNNPKLTRIFVKEILKWGTDEQRVVCLQSLRSFKLGIKEAELLNDLIKTNSRVDRHGTEADKQALMEQQVSAVQAVSTPTAWVIDRIEKVVAEDLKDIPIWRDNEKIRLVHDTVEKWIRDVELKEKYHPKLELQRDLQIIVLFIQSLLREGAVEVQDLFYTVQGLGTRYMWYREARELMMLVCGGPPGVLNSERDMLPVNVVMGGYAG
ncbi:hypothetical protein BZA77DRAFT_301747 [Pyronema omphalodes]|nr:hypothetical protein BZA77DRAFT_301747 [Pyronema omphalodes]